MTKNSSRIKILAGTILAVAGLLLALAAKELQLMPTAKSVVLLKENNSNGLPTSPVTASNTEDSILKANDNTAKTEATPLTDPHDHAPALRVISSERDELGILSSSLVGVDKKGYPNIVSNIFSFIDNSNLPRQGEQVSVQLTADVSVAGKVVISTQHESLSSLGIQLTSSQGTELTLHLTYGLGGVFSNGFILAQSKKYSFKILPVTSGEVLFQAVERESILPNEEGFLPKLNDPLLVAAGLNLDSSGDGSDNSQNGPLAVPPLLESRPGASGVVYLDFDGHTTTGTIWNSYNSGAPIVSAPASLSEAQITEVWKRVSESFSPFSINVTTSLAVFRAAVGNQKIRAVISPTSSWYPNAGGVAFIGSWAWAKGEASLDLDSPTFIFSNNLANYPKYIADATTHEVGHTLGLSHDGRISPSESYYQGQNVWAPNMGAGYYKPVVQWSRGEYASANNTEDDIAVMDTYPGVNLITDSVGGSIGAASALSFLGTQAQIVSLIERADDIDFFSFSAAAGDTTISADSTLVGNQGVLNLRLRLYNDGGTLLATAEPSSSGGVANIDASLGTIALSAGIYYIAVDGPGEGTANISGFSSYGNIGSYQLTVVIPAGSGTPIPAPTATATHTSIAPTATATNTSIPLIATNTPVATSTSTVTASATNTSTANPTNTPITTPTLTMTPTTVATITSTKTTIPTATATPSATTFLPTAAPTTVPDGCEGGGCESGGRPVAYSDRVIIKRDGTATFFLDGVDPDLLPAGGIIDVEISRYPQNGSIAPLIHSDTGSRNGADGPWNYSVVESVTGAISPLVYNLQSRSFTRSGNMPSSSDPAIIKRSGINLIDGTALVAEMNIAQSGTLVIVPAVATSFRSRVGNPITDSLGFTTYINGEPVSEREVVTKSTALNPGAGSVAVLVTSGDKIQVVIDRQGSVAQWQVKFFYAITSDHWRYEVSGKKGKADYLEFVVTDGQEDSEPARIDFSANKGALSVRKRRTIDELLMARVRALVVRLLREEG